MSVPLQIPAKAREGSYGRDQRKCARCGRRATEQSHRRSRAIRDKHTHCLCNLASACYECAHDFAHGQPAASRREGWTLRRTTRRPYEIPVLYRGEWVILGCDGSTRPAKPDEIEELVATA